jgi:predicted nucleotidyltransferase
MPNKDRVYASAVSSPSASSVSKIYSRVSFRIDELSAYCKLHHIKRLALFGSVLRDDFTPESDIDVLVEFKKGKSPGFLELADMEQALSTLLGERKIDMRTPQDLSPYFRDRVLQEAEVLCR